jgi:hypothetical protein
MTEGGYAQVADMSCATKMNGSRAYTMIGEAQYLAPEQISGQVSRFFRPECVADLSACVALSLFAGIRWFGER